MLFFMTACIEPYQFVIENKVPVLVVEGFVSNVSYQETLNYPGDGRYFYVKLSNTSDVINIRGEVVGGASVTLLANSGESWSYSEKVPGEYYLFDKEFKVNEGTSYKIQIVLANGEIYETDWQELPGDKDQSIGEISFKEVEEDFYRVIAGEQKVRPKKGIQVTVDLPLNKEGEDVYYRWDFEPIWVYQSPPPIITTCWIRSSTYMADYTVHQEKAGGRRQAIYFIETVRNDRIYVMFSLLVRQFILDENYFQFWNEMQTRATITLDDTPPYNLHTNLKPVGHSKAVKGYFGVVRESASRWYFDRMDLSYFVENTIKEDCKRYGGGPACSDCLGYTKGKATLEKPSWWLK